MKRNVNQLNRAIKNRGSNKEMIFLGDSFISKGMLSQKNRIQQKLKNSARSFSSVPQSKSFTASLIWNNNDEDGRYKIGVIFDKSSFGSNADYAESVFRSVQKDYLEKTAIELVDCAQSWGGGCNDFDHWMKLTATPSNGLSGCSSYVGRYGSAQTGWNGHGEQEISLGSGCIYKHTMIHEIKHALGWTHEQNRHDRDKYVEILWDNIDPRMKDNFEKEEGDASGTPYDPRSIMQYSAGAFSRNGQPTIRSKDPRNPIPDSNEYWSEEYINRGMTDFDALELNTIYNLHIHCKDKGGWIFSDSQGNIQKGVRATTGSTCGSSVTSTDRDVRVSLGTTTDATTATSDDSRRTSAASSTASTVGATDASTIVSPTAATTGRIDATTRRQGGGGKQQDLLGIVFGVISQLLKQFLAGR